MAVEDFYQVKDTVYELVIDGEAYSTVLAGNVWRTTIGDQSYDVEVVEDVPEVIESLIAERASRQAANPLPSVIGDNITGTLISHKEARALKIAHLIHVEMDGLVRDIIETFTEEDISIVEEPADYGFCLNIEDTSRLYLVWERTTDNPPGQMIKDEGIGLVPEEDS